ncbi:MAG: putative iron(III) transporter, ATP-binding protein [Bacteroidetes bacterium]|nr:putative iron(III) transporter, ATP-binding protein [Bacteroidota bacterium]
MDNKSCIKITGGVFGYRKNNKSIEILKNVETEFFEGDFIGLVGLNGSGKSTLMRSVCGLLTILNGEVFINGQTISSIPKTELAKKIAIVLTEKISGFNLTSFDAVAAGQIPYTNLFNKLEEQHLKIINEAIDICGLKDHHHKLLTELSDGLFQKTMIAKSIAQQTPIMLLDEPSAFLDYASKHELFILLRDLSTKQNKCVIVSSHDLDLLLKYCNKLLIVENSGVQLINVSEAKTNVAFNRLSAGYL